MFLHTVKWNYCLILFFFCYLILKIYLHKVSLCNPLLLQMPLFFFVVMLLKLIFHVLFIIRMNIKKKHCIQIFFL